MEKKYMLKIFLPLKAAQFGNYNCTWTKKAIEQIYVWSIKREVGTNFMLEIILNLSAEIK